MTEQAGVPLTDEQTWPEPPTITPAILDKWEASALDDLAAESLWRVNPLAILGVVRDMRALVDRTGRTVPR